VLWVPDGTGVFCRLSSCINQRECYDINTLASTLPPRRVHSWLYNCNLFFPPRWDCALCITTMVAAFVRLQLFFLILCTSCFALPLPFSRQAGLHLSPRAFIVNNATGTPEIFNSDTEQAVPQGRATDGGGTDFAATALLWIVFCFVIGVPMSVAGIRGWRFTIGVGLGLSAAVCCAPHLSSIL